MIEQVLMTKSKFLLIIVGILLMTSVIILSHLVADHLVEILYSDDIFEPDCEYYIGRRYSVDSNGMVALGFIFFFLNLF